MSKLTQEQREALAMELLSDDDAPTADVRENVRGEWVEDELGITVCSNCKNARRDNRIKHIAFCNSCGADMRGGGE